ncbi:hypothetical protein [Azospirillum sp.]|uniref:hypothetical protein n=1 Tax=Azospirillum sp. TaxID=34012 RepID=UPI003D75B1FF
MTESPPHAAWLIDGAGTTRRLVAGEAVAVVWLGETEWNWLVTRADEDVARGGCRTVREALAMAETALQAALSGWHGTG